MLSVALLATAIQLPVPFVPQEKDTCGAAALAMVMRYWGAETSHDAIAAALVDRELRGIRGSRLADFARERGMVAIAFAGERVILGDHLAKGRPLVVAIDAGRGRLHDVVAVGFDDARGEVIVHDPARGPERRVAAGEFERKWARSGHWTLLVQPAAAGPPGDLSSRGAFVSPGDEGSAGAGAEIADSSGEGTTEALRNDGAGTRAETADSSGADATDALGMTRLATDALGMTRLATDALGMTRLATDALGMTRLATDALLMNNWPSPGPSRGADAEPLPFPGSARHDRSLLRATRVPRGSGLGMTGLATDALGMTGLATDALGMTGRGTDALGMTGRGTDALGMTGRGTDALGATTEYDALVAHALEAGRAGQYAEAASALDRAIGLEPGRPEAWTERGGVRFLEGRYEEAVADLRRSLARREDAYARDLLASSLHLAGREIEALAAWNPLGKPALRVVEIGGLEKTSDRVARREVGLAEGETLTVAGLRAARRRLEETGVFERITLRPQPRGDGTADLDVALAERHGLAHGPVDFLVTTGVNLAWQRLRLRYSNLGGSGVSLGASHRWQENRPETALQAQWPRPLGLPASLRLAGFRGEQAYELGGAFDMRRRGIDAGLRHVLGGGTMASAGLKLRDRAFSATRPDAKPGLLAGLEAGLDTRLVEGRRHRLDATARFFAAGRALGSDVGYLQADAELRYEGLPSKPEGLAVERSVLAVRVRGGWGSDGLPVDEMYAPGVSPESDLPLRAHPLTRGGVLGANPVGRSVFLVNAEWRQRLVHRASWDFGAVAFSDTAWVGRPADGSTTRWLQDVGLGLRFSVLAGPTVRVDHAWGLVDGQRTLFIGLSQAF